MRAGVTLFSFLLLMIATLPWRNLAADISFVHFSLILLCKGNHLILLLVHLSCRVDPHWNMHTNTSVEDRPSYKDNDWGRWKQPLRKNPVMIFFCLPNGYSFLPNSGMAGLKGCVQVVSNISTQLLLKEFAFSCSQIQSSTIHRIMPAIFTLLLFFYQDHLGKL
jgi:hypothetical protein